MTSRVILRVLTFSMLVLAIAADNLNLANSLLVRKEVAHPFEFCDFYLSAYV
jgi:hypothetical protein